MYFKSEKGLGVMLFYILLPLGALTLLTLYSIIVYSNIRTFLIFPLCLVVLVDVMSIWMWIDTGYLISDEKLIIKCGPLRTSVDLKTIKSVKKIRSYDKQWALSFDRLQITYKSSSTICISPEKKDKFLEVLSEKCKFTTSDI